LHKQAALLLTIAFFCGAFSPGASAAVFANDPTNLSVGARELGMGRAFIGLADDTSAIFYNPGGLGLMSDWQVSSMSGKYVNTFDYLELSAVYPTDLGTFGLGYAGSSLGFSFPSSEVIIIGDEKRIVPTGEVSGSYSNSALLLSYGKKISFPYVKNLALGGSLKLLSQNLSANVEASGTASGMELVVGSRYPINQEWNVGASVVNVLPASLGGKITWSNNSVETFPALLKLGVAYNNLANKAPSTTPRINATLDYDTYLTRPDAPALGHLGLEWFPSPTVALRVGIDQSQIASSLGGFAVSNDVTYGLGLYYNSYRFDFAYHMYNSIADDTTSYFSLSYSPEKKPAPVERKYFTVTSPLNGAIVYEDKVNIAGRVLEGSVDGIFVGMHEATLADNSFNLFVDVRPGANIFMVEASDKNGAILGRYRTRVVRLLSFLDVYMGYWAQLPIEQLATLGIITGYPDRTFRPESTIDRAELTALLVRSQANWPASSEAKQLRFRAASAEAGADPFTVMAEAVKQVPGFPEDFPADGWVTRAESAALLGLFFDLPMPESDTLPYGDIGSLYAWVAPYLAMLRGTGALDFFNEAKFAPDRPLTLGEMNDMLAALGAKDSYPRENYDPDEKVSNADLCGFLFKIRDRAIAGRVSLKLEAERKKAAKNEVPAMPFTDVIARHWAAVASAQRRKEELVTLGVVEVAPGAEFKLDASLTRGDLAIWLAKASDAILPRVSKDLYSDVPRSDPLAPYIKVVVDAGLMSPFPDGTFRPNNAIDRAVADQVSARIAEERRAAAAAALTAQATQGGARLFWDVPRNHWAAAYISQAVDQAMVTGYPDGSFQPAKPISRAEGLAVITRFAGLTKQSAGAAPYRDVPGRYWAAPAIAAAKDEGLLDYIKGDLCNPNGDLQRSEVAYILSKVGPIKRLINEKL
jgi:hypothetical protein